MSASRPIASPDDQLAFMLAGRATFTVVSRRTGCRHTYRVERRRDAAPDDPLFVSVLTGPSNRDDYTFLGTLFPTTPVRLGKRRPVPVVYRHGRRSSIGEGAPSSAGFAWLMRHLAEGGDGSPYEFWHEGRCGRCGRALTVPESLEVGIGPDCLAASGR